MALFGGHKSVLGLDIGTSAVKVVELTRAGNSLLVTGAGSAVIESPEAVGDAIQEALTQSGIKTKKCVTAVSGRSVIIRQVSMVEMPDTELRTAIEYEADKYIPFDVAEVELDAQRLPTAGENENGQMKVLLVAVKKTMVEEHLALLQSLGLQPMIIDVDCFALGNAFELRNLSLGIADEEVRALVDIGASKTNINIMRGNLSYFQREIYVAGNDLTDAVAKRFGEDPKDVEKMKKDPGGALESMQDAMLPVLEDIGSEIRLSFDYFENQYDEQVKEVYISGGSALFPGMDTMLTQIFSLPTQVWDPMEGLQVSGYAATVAAGNSDMSVSLGLAARILSAAGLTTRVVESKPGEEADVAAMIAGPQIGVVETPANKSAWNKGLLAGTIASAVMAVGAFFLNKSGYANPLVILEGVVFGIAMGIGMWTGFKTIRPIPGKGALGGACAMIGLILCGVLLGGRVASGVPFGQPPVKAAAMQPERVDRFSQDGEFAKERMKGLSEEARKRAMAFRQRQAERPKTMTVDDYSAIIFAFAQFCVSAFVGIMLLARNFSKADLR